jgi:hypothetical protein
MSEYRGVAAGIGRAAREELLLEQPKHQEEAA